MDGFQYVLGGKLGLFSGENNPRNLMSTENAPKDQKQTWKQKLIANGCKKNVSLRSTPHPVTVTTRIITFLVGNPYKPSFATVTGWGVDPTYLIYIIVFIYFIFDRADQGFICSIYKCWLFFFGWYSMESKLIKRFDLLFSTPYCLQKGVFSPFWASPIESTIKVTRCNLWVMW